MKFFRQGRMYMSLCNRFVLVVALLSLAFLAGCGSSNPSAVPPPTGGFSNSNLNGTYVFSITGTDVNGDPYAMVGSFAANGSGGITGGTVDINDLFFTTTSPVTAPVANAAISSSSGYKVGVDGRGTATLGTSTPFGTIGLDFVLSTSSHGLVSEMDNNGTGSGTIDLQTTGLTQSSLAGNWAFSFSGVDESGTAPFAAAGAFTLNQTGGITAGLEDLNDGGIDYGGATGQGLGGSVILGPSSTPATALDSSSFSLSYDVYAIDATHLKFIELDSSPILSGDAYSQTSATIPAGTLAFTLSGFFSAEPASFGGYMITDGNGDITNSSTEDFNLDGTTVSSAPVSFSGSYAAAGTGRFLINNLSGFTGGGNYAAYPSSGGVLLLEIDNDPGQNIQVGAAYAPETSGASFQSAQGYGLNLSGDNVSADGIEVDDIAEFSTSTGNLTGLIDENSDPSGQLVQGLALTGTYGSPDSNGRFGLTATAGTSSTTTVNGGFALTCYTVDGVTFPFIESDSGQVSAGVMVQQNAGSSSAVSSHMFVAQPLVRLHGATASKFKKK
jgi:hypothetical protein